MRYLLDTNILSALAQVPNGYLAERIGAIGEGNVYTSVIVAAELRFGAAKRGSDRLSRQVEHVLPDMDVAGFSPPADRSYGAVRRALEGAGKPIGANDLLIASHALCDASVMVTGNVGGVSRVPGLRVENWLER